MSHPSKSKGNGYERELRDYFRALGIESERAWGSDGRAMGLDKEVDVTANGCLIQCKRRKVIPKDLRIPEKADVTAFREDRGETFILMRLKDFAEIVKEGW